MLDLSCIRIVEFQFNLRVIEAPNKMNIYQYNYYTFFICTTVDQRGACAMEERTAQKSIRPSLETPPLQSAVIRGEFLSMEALVEAGPPREPDGGLKFHYTLFIHIYEYTAQQVSTYVSCSSLQNSNLIFQISDYLILFCSLHTSDILFLLIYLYFSTY